MAVRIMCIDTAATLTEVELTLLGSSCAEYGRTVLLVPRFADRNVCRRSLARHGLGVGIEVTTPASWVASLWELLGDGRQLVSSLSRSLLLAHVLASTAGGARGTADTDVSSGIVNMFFEAARDMLPYLPARADALSPGEAAICTTLERYRDELEGRGLIETSTAAVTLAQVMEDARPACARAVLMRGVHDVPEYLIELLATVARTGALTVLVEGEAADVARALAKRFASRDIDVVVDPGLDARDAVGAPALSQVARSCSFFPVAGPAAREAAYTAIIEQAVSVAPVPADGPHARVAVASRDPRATFRALAPRLAAHGIAAQISARRTFGNTRAGEAIAMLADFLDRMNTEEASSWWPAPEIPDWIRSPFSGLAPASPRVARMLDARLRKTRQMDGAALAAELESLQSREINRERARAEEQGRARRVIVVKDVIDALGARRFARAVQLMYDAARTAPVQAFGALGVVGKQEELAALEAALEVFAETRRLGISEEQAFTVLPSCSYRAAGICMEPARGAVPSGQADGSAGVDGAWPAEAGARSEDDAAAPAGDHTPLDVAFCTLDALASEPAATYGMVILLDVDAESHPLAQHETPVSILAEKLGCAGVHAAPLGCQRIAFARACAAGEAAALAYVAHDSQADECYPAPAYSELEEARRADAGARADAGCAAASGSARTRADALAAMARLELPTEAALYENLDRAAGAGTRRAAVRVAGMHTLDPALHHLLLLPERSVGGRAVPRTLSASQIENYLACPYRWLVSNRVSTRRLDVVFGPIERGNFVHDVMQRFHERLIECGLMRVRPETVEACMAEMDGAFADIVEDHRAGKYTHGKYARSEKPRVIRGALVPLDTLERSQMQAMLAELHEVVRYESEILSIYTPALFEYSFDREGVTYAGHALGGRIDRIDVAPSAGAGERFVVIDYKNRASVKEFVCDDPTMAIDEHEVLPDTWLPGRMNDAAPKVQTLIYAQALERVSDRVAQGAVYLGTRGPATAGAVSDALVSSEPPAFPNDTVSGYPGVRKPRSRTAKHDGSIEFQELLDQVEHAIAGELAALEHGAIAPRPASDSCTYCPIKICEMRR